MQGLYSTPLNIPNFYQQTSQIFDMNITNFNNQGFLSLLMVHKQMI